MNTRRMTKVLVITMAATLCVCAAAPHPAEKAMLNLGDFDWTVGKLRSQLSVQRERPACVSVTKGKDEEFKSGEKPFSIIPVTLKAKKAGELVLVPELFLVRDGGLYGAYCVCQGVRIVEPKPDPRTAAFHPPANAAPWPGHAGFIACKAGESVVIELLFKHVHHEDAEILAASPVATLQGAKTQKMHNKTMDSEKK